MSQVFFFFDAGMEISKITQDITAFEHVLSFELRDWGRVCLSHIWKRKEFLSRISSAALLYRGDAAVRTHSILAHNTSQYRKNLETKAFLTHAHSSFLYLRQLWYGILKMLDKVIQIRNKLSSTIRWDTMR